MKAVIYLLSILLIISCNQPDSIRKNESFKDSVLKQFFSIVDSIGFYDTTTYDFNILKAYANDDTIFFKKMKKNLDQYVEPHVFNGTDKCILPKKLSDLPVDEAYRFIYTGSFCFFGQSVTISKKGDSIKLHFVDYILPYQENKKMTFSDKNGTQYVVDSNCVIVKQFEKSLQPEDWDNLEQALDNTDYWGLKTHNPTPFLDPSFWQIDAYTRQPRYSTNQQVHSVIRSSSSMSSFIALGLLFMKLSGEKIMCNPD
ncbi:MAG: hypothetical protein H7Y01_03985 [Ferruginibacter sp.]|nr:hypothetical protein [Chitinophagaceae bacterium]